MKNCDLCGGDAGTFINGTHALCSALHNLGLPTPSLGDECPVCNGNKTTGTGGVFLFSDLGPATMTRSINAQFPPCTHCNGTGLDNAIT